MKKTTAFICSLLVGATAVAGLAGCELSPSAFDENAYSYITVDINPSVELVARGDTVVDVKAGNYDACVLLDGEDFSSMTVADATEKIVSLAEELGYLTDTNNRVNISVLSDSAASAEALKNIAKAGAEKGSKKAQATSETRLQDELTLNKLKAEKPEAFASLTEEKVRLIESVMEYDESMTYETGASLTVTQLTAALQEADGTSLITSGLRGEYSARYSAAKLAIEREMAAIHGEEYLSAWEAYTALNTVYGELVSEIEKAGISSEDTARIISLLQITDSSLIEKSGTVKPEYVLSYIDKHISKKSTQANGNEIAEVLEILKAYDTENYVLTEEQCARISDAIGEHAYKTLAEVAASVSERKEVLDGVKQSVQLTVEQIAEIKALKESFSSIREQVLSNMSDLIASTRAEITARKQSLRTN